MSSVGRFGLVVLSITATARGARADDAPDPAFGLLDRMRVAPFYLGATQELSSYDHGATTSTTLHVQASTECECHFSFYGTLPVSIQLRHPSPTVAASGAPGVDHEPGTALGTADVGVFGGGRRGVVTTLFRVGALLPTATREPHAWLPSARAGDRVLELPRSAGVRTSVAREYSTRSDDHARGPTFRVEVGIDVASVLAATHDPVHVVPRAGAGMLVTPSATWSYALETAISADPFVGDGVGLRWSGGVTARFARHHGHVSFVQPAVTLATSRAGDGWATSLLVDLVATTAALADGYAE
jgi:hypothetical protein